jgi:hypothetical protein
MLVVGSKDHEPLAIEPLEGARPGDDDAWHLRVGGFGSPFTDKPTTQALEFRDHASQLPVPPDLHSEHADCPLGGGLAAAPLQDLARREVSARTVASAPTLSGSVPGYPEAGP